MFQNTLTNSNKKNRKRVGRGIAAGQGKTAGRGHKGQKARTGKKLHPIFEGGQTPLFMKMPKLKGFNNPNHISFQVVNVSDFDKINGTEVTRKSLADAGLIKGKSPIKILGNGDISKKYIIKVDAISQSAKEKIEKAGGSVELAKKPANVSQ